MGDLDCCHNLPSIFLCSKIDTSGLQAHLHPPPRTWVLFFNQWALNKWWCSKLHITKTLRWWPFITVIYLLLPWCVAENLRVHLYILEAFDISSIQCVRVWDMCPIFGTPVFSKTDPQTLPYAQQDSQTSIENLPTSNGEVLDCRHVQGVGSKWQSTPVWWIDDPFSTQLHDLVAFVLDCSSANGKQASSDKSDACSTWIILLWVTKPCALSALFWSSTLLHWFYTVSVGFAWFHIIGCPLTLVPYSETVSQQNELFSPWAVLVLFGLVLRVSLYIFVREDLNTHMQSWVFPASDRQMGASCHDKMLTSCLQEHPASWEPHDGGPSGRYSAARTGLLAWSQWLSRETQRSKLPNEPMAIHTTFATLTGRPKLCSRGLSSRPWPRSLCHPKVLHFQVWTVGPWDGGQSWPGYEQKVLRKYQLHSKRLHKL